jgi:hypothetical protein
MTILSTRARAFLSRSHPQETANLPRASSEQWQTSHWGAPSGRFVTSPWEGLHWEACPSSVSPSLPESEELVGSLDKFLHNLTYGE